MCRPSCKTVYLEVDQPSLHKEALQGEFQHPPDRERELGTWGHSVLNPERCPR